MMGRGEERRKPERRKGWRFRSVYPLLMFRK